MGLPNMGERIDRDILDTVFARFNSCVFLPFQETMKLGFLFSNFAFLETRIQDLAF
jgi:hypothetical protein